MEKLTYKQAYDKIIQAYFRDEIKPYDSAFCFCGTLCDRDRAWANNSYLALYTSKPHNDFGNYSGIEYMKMEKALLTPLENDPKNEDKLFAGMCAALEVLKQIHKERGEDVDGVQEFTKRELVKQI